jgi:D-alanine-D-alanine ligase
MKKLRVLVLMHEDCVPPAGVTETPTDQIPRWKTEFDVLRVLGELGHETHPLAVSSDLKPIREAVEGWKPDVVFVLLEEFHGRQTYVPYVVGYLELLRQPYTGCNPDGLMLAAGKALQKKILRHHRIAVPDFHVFAIGQRVRRPPRLKFPLIVKSTTAHGSVGIAQASIINDDEKLKERVQFIHDQVQTDAIAEQYIEGRELYLGLLGNQRIQALPVWEMVFENLPEGAAAIATERMKWSVKYQKKVGLITKAAEDLPADVTAEIQHVCKRAYRALSFSGYARIDMRLAADGKVYLLECNPNPNLGHRDDFADSAEKAGITYAQLIERILGLGLRHHSVQAGEEG